MTTAPTSGDNHALAAPRILLGITGGIAAYKAAELSRLWVKAGAQVQVVMTESAQRFITAQTFQALTGRSVRSSLSRKNAECADRHGPESRNGHSLSQVA